MYNPQRKIYFITISMWAYLLLPPLAAQQLKKQINFGGSGTDNAMDLIKTADNNLIVIGSSSSGKSGDKNSDGFGDLDFWIVKCTPKGKILWQQTYGGDQVDEPRTILETENRDLVIAGNSMSGVSGNKKTPLIGKADFWVLRLDKEGNLLWQKSFGKKDVSTLSKMIPLSNGNFLLSGYTWIEPSSVPGSKKVRYEYWLITIDGLGNMISEKTLGGNHDDMLETTTQLRNKDILLTGFSLSGATGDKSEPNLGDFDFWTIALNEELSTIKWQKTTGTDKDDRPSDIVETQNGVFVGGASPMNVPGQALSNYYLCQFDADGAFKKSIRYGGDENDYLSTLTLTSDGGFLIGGVSQSGISGDKSEKCFGIFDVWAMKCDASGKLLWDKTIGGNQFETISKIIPFKRKCYILVIQSESGNTGNLTKPGKGGYDYVLVYLKDQKVRKQK